MPEIVYPNKPDWEPLQKAIGEKYKCFMFMGKVAFGELWIYLYKHVNTRRYLNLDGRGGAYRHEKGTYWPIDVSLAIERVFE